MATRPKKTSKASSENVRAAIVLPRSNRAALIRTMQSQVECDRYKSHDARTLADVFLYALQRACEDEGLPQLVPPTFHQGDLGPLTEELGERLRPGLLEDGMGILMKKWVDGEWVLGRLEAMLDFTWEDPEPPAKEPSWSERIVGKSPETFKAYSPEARYQANDLVSHSKFGLGFVLRIVEPTKIEVLFEQGHKMLGQARGAT